MSWTYSGDPGNSDLDQVRFTVQDTDAATPLLQDEEIQWLIDKWLPKYDSLTMVSSICAATIARKFAQVVSTSADSASVQLNELYQRYVDMAKQLVDEFVQESTGGEVNLDNVLIGTSPDPSIRPLRFGVGMHDNPQAGNQDYGGWTYDPWNDVNSVLAGA